MKDTYRTFSDLSLAEAEGVDYRIILRDRNSRILILAPHGGGVEPGTSEICTAIAGEQLSFYCFEGIKETGNRNLHITSTNFDEPIALSLARRADYVITIHGCADHEEVVFLGGLYTDLISEAKRSLEECGFESRRHSKRALQGTDPSNICNKGKCGRGLQLEVSQKLRAQLFRNLSKDGRKYQSNRFDNLVTAVREAILPVS